MPVKIPVNGAGKGGNDYILEATFAENMVESLQQQRKKYVELDDAAMVLKIDEQIDYYSSADAPRTEGYEYVEPVRTYLVSEHGPELAIASTEPGCTHDDCVLMHPHAGPAILSSDAAREAGLVQDRKSGSWRAPRPPGRPSGE
jgi:hypothetical protein